MNLSERKSTISKEGSKTIFNLIEEFWEVRKKSAPIKIKKHPSQRKNCIHYFIRSEIANVIFRDDAYNTGTHIQISYIEHEELSKIESCNTQYFPYPFPNLSKIAEKLREILLKQPNNLDNSKLKTADEWKVYKTWRKKEDIKIELTGKLIRSARDKK